MAHGIGSHKGETQKMRQCLSIPPRGAKCELARSIFIFELQAARRKLPARLVSLPRYRISQFSIMNGGNGDMDGEFSAMPNFLYFSIIQLLDAPSRATTMGYWCGGKWTANASSAAGATVDPSVGEEPSGISHLIN